MSREDEIARGVARGMAEHRRKVAEAHRRHVDRENRRMLGCLLFAVLVIGGFLFLLTWADAHGM
ncbi:hypothetical protein [Streptomyces mirabilis]|uniref:hypothetical protein n=1 Tax=Streptomyces mirabilis TaxID=68239 RepID=UPI00369DEFC5